LISYDKIKRVTLIILLFALTANTHASVFDDKERAIPGETVEAGQIYIQIIHEIAPLRIEEFDGIIMTGIPALDAVADVFGVYKIEKTFMMKTSPQDPSIPDLSRYYTVYFPEEYGSFTLIEAYETCVEIPYADFVTIGKYCYVPNDPRYRNQWHLPHCNLPEAWDFTHGSEEIIIGIVDSGLDLMADGFEFGLIHEEFA